MTFSQFFLHKMRFINLKMFLDKK